MERVKIAREAVKLLKYYISNEISFNQETTLSGKSIILPNWTKDIL